MNMIQAAHEKRLQNMIIRHIEVDNIVLGTIRKLGGNIQMRVMDFRKHMQPPLRESEIKQSLKRLSELGKIELSQEGGQGKRMKLL
jgi:hypothetical protein